MKYISDVILVDRIDKGSFNLVHSGCGSGKSYFVLHELLNLLPEFQPSEIMFLTSRSIIVDQQAQSDSAVKFNSKDIDIIKYWNGESAYFTPSGIHLMTYDKLSYILNNCNSPDKETLDNVKVIVLDECHTMFSDNFIKGMDGIKIWIRDMINHKNKIFMGLTATPNILHYFYKQWGVKINSITDEPIFNYGVKNLYCTSYDGLFYILREPYIQGKSIVLCYSIGDCNKLFDVLGDAVVLISKSNQKYEKEMEDIREYIVNNNSLPEEVFFRGKTRNVKYLITTTTLREGINLDECSGVKNVICCIPDELHITQFVGRCRYNIENLIVVDEYIPKQKFSNTYYANRRNEFKNYISDKDDMRWFNSIKHLMDEKCKQPVRYLLDRDSFKSYIRDKWLSNGNIEKPIITKQQRDEILGAAKGCNINCGQRSKLTFNQVMIFLGNDLNFRVETNRRTEKGIKYTYKLIYDK